MRRFILGLVQIAVSASALHADALDEYAKNYPFMIKGSFQVEKYSFIRSEKREKLTSTSTLFYDIDKTKLITKSVEEKIVKGKTQAFSRHYENIVSNELKISFNLFNSKIDGILSDTRSTDNKEIRSIRFNDIGYFAEGYFFFYNDKKISDVIRSGPYKISEENLDGKLLTLIESDNEYGLIQLWVDPQQSYLPIKFIQFKDEDDLTDDNIRLRDNGIEYLSDKENYAKTYQWVIDTNQISQYRGKSYISEYSLRCEMNHAKSGISKGSYRLKIKNPKFVDYWETDPFQPSIPIPNGTRVTEMSEQHINYEWRDGKIVKSVQQSEVAKIEQTKFKQADNSNSLRWIMLAVFALLSFLLVFRKLR